MNGTEQENLQFIIFNSNSSTTVVGLHKKNIDDKVVVILRWNNKSIESDIHKLCVYILCLGDRYTWIHAQRKLWGFKKRSFRVKASKITKKTILKHFSLNFFIILWQNNILFKRLFYYIIIINTLTCIYKNICQQPPSLSYRTWWYISYY